MRVGHKNAAMLILSTVLLTACGGSPQSAVEGFYRAIDAGNSKKALDYFDQETRQMWGGKLVAAIAQNIEKAEKCGGIDDIKTEQIAERGDLRVIKATVSFKNDKCTRTTEDFRLIKSDGSWRIVLN